MDPHRRKLIHLFGHFPYTDEIGEKGWFGRLARPQPHRVQRLTLALDGWPRWPRPLRIAFLSDFHVGSHTGDVARLEAIAAETAAARPDLVLLGGDYMNMQPLGGGRVSPRRIAAILAGIDAPLGRVAVLGNHDVSYGAGEVEAALRAHGIDVLHDGTHPIAHINHAIDIAGIPDARVRRAGAVALLEGLRPDRPTLVLAHDPMWFAEMPAGPHLMLAGHTHGGQVRLPRIGAIVNASRAPLRWSYGLIEEGGRRLYVTSGIGTSGIPLRFGIPPEIVLIEIAGA